MGFENPGAEGRGSWSGPEEGAEARSSAQAHPGLQEGGDVSWVPVFQAASASVVSVSSPEGGLVTIECHYDLQWESYGKWGCHRENWGSCQTLMKTTSSEKLVWKG